MGDEEQQEAESGEQHQKDAGQHDSRDGDETGAQKERGKQGDRNGWRLSWFGFLQEMTPDSINSCRTE